MSNALDEDCFRRRVKRLYQNWKEPEYDPDDTLKKSDCIMSAVGSDVEVMYSKSTALLIWLLGYELTDTITIFTESSIYFLASEKTIKFLKPIEGIKDEDIPQVKLLVKDKNDKDKANFVQLLEVMKESKNVGAFKGEDNFPEEFYQAWGYLLAQNTSLIDISSALGWIMAIKEEPEILTVKKACLVTVDIFTNYLKEHIMEIIDADKKVKHSKLAEGVEQALTDVSGVDTSQLDMCYPAIIQSGGNYSLKFSAVSDKNHLHFGAIVCSLGVRYKSYCSNIVRTLLVNPNEKLQDQYSFLVNMEENMLKVMVPGKKLSYVYEKGLEYATKEQPALVEKLTKTFGFAMGLEFRDNSLIIGPNFPRQNPLKQSASL